MGYLLTEIVVYLVIAGLIGFAFGWLVRDGALDKVTGLMKKQKEEVNKIVETKETVTEVAEVAKETVKTEESIKEEPKVEVIEEAVAEISTPTEIVENREEVVKPTLFTEAPAEGKDKLSTIKGIGPVLEKKLNELGIYTFEQIASWDAEQEVWIGSQMTFPKKVTNEEWVKQAKDLVAAK